MESVAIRILYKIYDMKIDNTTRLLLFHQLLWLHRTIMIMKDFEDMIGNKKYKNIHKKFESIECEELREEQSDTFCRISTGD